MIIICERIITVMMLADEKRMKSSCEGTSEDCAAREALFLITISASATIPESEGYHVCAGNSVSATIVLPPFMLLQP